MRKMLIIAFLLLMGTYCFAGSFYGNITALAVQGEALLSFLASLGGVSACIAAGENKPSVIYEKRIDEQVVDYGVFLSQKISAEFKTVTVFVINHDSDILLVYAHQNGQQIFFYNSDPSYFNDEGGDESPEISGFDALLAAFPEADKEELRDLLDDQEADADELHEGLVELLDLPVWTCGLGYNSVEDFDDELKEQFGVVLLKVGI